MKRHIKLLTIGTLLLGGLTGCNDFLDREPLDKVIPEKYFASESDLAAYTINAYPFETVTDAASTSSAKITILITKPAVTLRNSGYPDRRKCRRVKANGTGRRYVPATISLTIPCLILKRVLSLVIRIM